MCTVLEWRRWRAEPWSYWLCPMLQALCMRLSVGLVVDTCLREASPFHSVPRRNVQTVASSSLTSTVPARRRGYTPAKHPYGGRGPFHAIKFPLCSMAFNSIAKQQLICYNSGIYSTLTNCSTNVTGGISAEKEGKGEKKGKKRRASQPQSRGPSSSRTSRTPYNFQTPHYGSKGRSIKVAPYRQDKQAGLLPASMTHSNQN